ncbi:MAG: YifB family Mg chelatase-like AAA ATPase [Lachnospiraceae bacterium]|nr:YifB family Mg chelatase-like AAA ATPase [Lachnospiraceae bacterium]
MYSKIVSGAILGISAYMVTVEVDVSAGLPSFHMVGLLSCEVRESKERVWTALKNAGVDIPPTHITVNLSPADLKKEGTALDLPIAVAMLEALGYFKANSVKDILFLGELGLNGEVKSIRGVLPIVQEAARQGIRECIVPEANAQEGAVLQNVVVRGVSNLEEVIRFLKACDKRREELLPACEVQVERLFQETEEVEENDFVQVKGQEGVKRAALIAASGFHNLLMVGAPGTGKSMIAKRIPQILPPLTLEESLEVTSIASVAGLLKEKQALVTKRPFQNPHHTISAFALTGGGLVPRPGVISLAHRGVLFLDELPEFQRSVIDSMRQPIEERSVQVARLHASITYPADFMLVAAMNPCPCGYYPDRNRCRCTTLQIKKYLSRVSGPILDRIDLCVELQAVDVSGLQKDEGTISSGQLRRQVQAARKRQKERFLGTRYCFNSEIAGDDLEKYCMLGFEERKCMEDLYESLNLSARAYHRILKVARTIADLAGVENIEVEHLLEAACYRPAQDYWI